jgi:hypothetical protein
MLVFCTFHLPQSMFRANVDGHGLMRAVRPEATTARSDIIVEPFGDAGVAARSETESDVDRRDDGPVDLFRPHIVPIDDPESASD